MAWEVAFCRGVPFVLVVGGCREAVAISINTYSRGKTTSSVGEVLHNMPFHEAKLFHHLLTFPFRALCLSLLRNQCSVVYSVRWIFWQAEGAGVPAAGAGTSSKVSGSWKVSVLRPVKMYPLILVGYQWKAEMDMYGQVSRMVRPLRKQHKGTPQEKASTCVHVWDECKNLADKTQDKV